MFYLVLSLSSPQTSNSATHTISKRLSTQVIFVRKTKAISSILLDSNEHWVTADLIISKIRLTYLK